MKFFLVFFTMLFYPLLGHGQSEPWYRIQDIEKLEINIFFEQGTLNLKSYYDFHIKQFARIVKNNSSLSIVVVHNDSSGLSKLRAKRIHDVLTQRFLIQPRQIHVTSGLPAVYAVSKGEKVMLHVRKNFQEKFKKRLPAAKLPKKKKDYIYINRTPQKKYRSLAVSLGASSYEFSNSAQDLFALSLNAHGKKRATDFLNTTLDVGYTFSDSSFASHKEYHLALGLESEFNLLNLNTKVYGRKNWAWVASDSKFVTVNDLGLHQGLDFKLVRRPSYSLTIGAWVELSLSNTVSDLRSTNVLSFKTEIKLDWFNQDVYLSLYRLSRKYKVFDADILGLSFGYTF